MSQAENLIAEAAERGVVLTLSIDELPPNRIIELLGKSGHSARVSIKSSGPTIVVEIGGGLVVGAEAKHAAGVHTGEDAYALIRDVREGSVRIEPLRFPSLANILKPLADIVDLSPLPTVSLGDDTVEVSLHEARPVHVSSRMDPKTIPNSLPPIPADASIAPPPPTIPTPTRVTAPPAMPETKPLAAPSSRRRAAAALAAVGVAALMGLAWVLAQPSSPDEYAQTPVSASPAPTTPTAPTAVELPEPPSDAEVRETALAEARELGRIARELLQKGDAPAGLREARRALELRPSVPFYHVLVGDALRANGQRAAARRAYLRATRLRPGYPPALRRLNPRRAT